MKVSSGLQLGLKGGGNGALVPNTFPVDQVKPALEGPSLHLTVTFAAVPVQDVAVYGSVCGVDQEDQRPTHESNLPKYLITSDWTEFQTISKMFAT
jgi:hypothetical protein